MTTIPNRRQFLQTAAAASLACGADQVSSEAEAARRSSRRSSRHSSRHSSGVPTLPQDDPRPYFRRRDLSLEQRRFQYNYTHLSPLAMVDRLPLSEGFSIQWLTQVADRTLRLLENLLIGAGDSKERSRQQARRRDLSKLSGAAAPNPKLMLQMVEQSIAGVSNVLRPDSLDDYAELFRAIELPPIAAEFQDDKVFALMRVAGPNPLMIQRIDQLDGRFPVTEAIYQNALPNDTLAAAGAEGRLFLADFKLLEDIETAEDKLLFAPLALFAVDPVSKDLVPIAIQTRQQPGPANPIFGPGDGYNWLIAKTIVEVADGNMHEMVSHLGRTHLFMEPFAIATHRQLSPNHPLGVLLRAHFDGTLAINYLSHDFLAAEGGPVQRLLAGELSESKRLAADAVRTYDFNDAMLPETFRARGVDDLATLPNYPYRDDSWLYWDTIRSWASDYLSIYYDRDEKVRGDHELANWQRELVARDGGRIVGLGENGGIHTRDYLVDAVTLIIYTSSVQHAAVGYPQFDLMSYVPNMPLAAYAPPVTDVAATEQDFLDVLPPLNRANLQLAILYILGTVKINTLGEYGPRYFTDPRVRKPLEDFNRELASVGAMIDLRNLNRRPYDFLERAGIPQSITI